MSGMENMFEKLNLAKNVSSVDIDTRQSQNECLGCMTRRFGKKIAQCRPNNRQNNRQKIAK
jgi:hypothetical protein